MTPKALCSPNAVKWSNGYVSSMPDWTTARECAASKTMAYLLKEFRVFFMAAEKGQLFAYDESRRKAMMERLSEVIGFVSLGIDERSEWTAAEFKPMPRPPGR